jgi:zinc protease
MKSTITALFSVVIVLGVLWPTSEASAQAPQKITEIEGISEYKLDNGVQLLLFPDDSKPQVTVNVTVLVGSRHEGYGETGMAHLLEHMLFKGTTRRTDIPKLLKDRGVLNMNGTTWYDRTNYYETLPAEGDNLEFMLDMESDRLVNSLIDGNELQKEMTVVRNEFERGENSPNRILFQRIMANAYEWHNYGKSTIGNRTDIERVPVQNLRQFYRKYYRPDNVMVMIAGKFDADSALELSQKYFGALVNPKAELPKTYTEEPIQDGERVVILRRVGDVQVAGVGYHIPPAAHEDYPACEVLGSILGIEPSGRLYKGLVEGEIASSVSTQLIAGHDPGMLLAFCEVPKDGNVEKARDAMLTQIESIGETGVEDSEVKRIVQRMVKRREQQMSNTAQLAIGLSDWRAYGDWRLYFLHRDRVEKVTAADVQRVAQKYMMKSNRTVGLFYPTEEPTRVAVPTAPKLDKLLADYKGRAKMAAGESFEPTPDNIESRTTVGKFDSGVKFAMLPKKSRGERITVSGVLKYGNVNSLNGKANLCETFPSMLTRGTTSLDFQAFRDRMDEIKTNLRIGGAPGAVTINLQTDRENFSAALDLLKDALKNPVWDEQRFNEMKRESLTALESSLSDPQAKAFTEFQRVMSPYEVGDPRYIETIEESIASTKAMTIGQLKSTYEQFMNGQHGQFAFVGDFDPVVAKSKMNDILSGWTTDEPYERIASPANLDVQGQRITINTPDKANSVYVAGMQLPVGDDSEGKEALEIGNYILGGGPLSSRLADRVRKKEGLSYGVGSMFRASAQDERSMLMMFAISNPENSPKVVETIDEEVKRWLSSGVTGEELENAKESFIKTRTGGRANDGQLASTLLSNLEMDRTMSFQKEADAKILDLTKEQVDETLRKFVDPDRLIIVTAGDFEKAKEGEDKESEDEEK